MSAPTDALLIYTTFPDIGEAKSVAAKIVESRLAACANIIPGMVSIYEWEGKLEEDNEVIVIFKTRQALQNEVIGKIKELHSYSIPAVLALDVQGTSAEFKDWIFRQTRI